MSFFVNQNIIGFQVSVNIIHFMHRIDSQRQFCNVKLGFLRFKTKKGTFSVRISFFCNKVIRSPPGRYSMTKQRLQSSQKAFFSYTIHSFLEMARMSLSARIWATWFFFNISYLIIFLIATTSWFSRLRQRRTSPKAPLPIIFKGSKLKAVTFWRLS